MRHFVLQLMRGLLFCLVAISVTACSDLVQELQGEQSGMYPALQSKGKITELARIDKIRMRVAQNALSNEDYDTAIRFFNSVHESAPVNPLPLIGLGEANLALGKLHEAETAYRSAVRVDPRSARALEGLGTVLVSRSAFEDAIDHFNQSLAQMPSASLHNKLGVAHDLKGDGVGAQRHYRAALVLDPNIVSARNNLALSLVVSQAYDEAIGEMEQVAAHPNSTARHKQNLAFVYGMAGRFDSASATLRENGVSQDEITQNRSLYSRMRDMAKRGNRTELLAFLRNAEPGDNLPEADLSQPAAVSSDLASATPDGPMKSGSVASSTDQDTLRKEDKVLPPNTLENISKIPDNISRKPGDMSPAPGKKMPEPLPETLPESMTNPVTKPAPETKMAKLSDAAQPIAVKTPVSLPDVDLATGPYRIQLASYRTSKNTGRGQNVLAALLGEDSDKLQLFVRKSRNDAATGFDFRIRSAPFEKREAGLKLCGEIRTNGHDGCLVIKHNASLWEPLKLETPVVVPVPVRVQLASFRTEKGAEKGQKILKKMLGDKTGELEILVRRSPRGSPKSFNYRIRTTPIKSRKEAQDLCAAFKVAGHADCIIILQNDEVWKTAATLAEVEHAFAGPQFRIQLASYRSRRNAFAAQDRLAKIVDKHISPAYLLTTVEFLTNEQKKLYRIFVPNIPTRIKAAKLCEEMREAGLMDCLVVSQAPA